MSRSYEYYSDSWAPREGGRQHASSRVSDQGLPYRIVPRPDDQRHAPFDLHPTRYETHHGLSHNSIYPLAREPGAPVSAPRDRLPQPYQDDREMVGYSGEMIARSSRPLSSDSAYRMRSLDTRDEYPSRAPSSFPLAHPGSQSIPSRQDAQAPRDDPGRAFRPIYPDGTIPPPSLISSPPWDTGYQLPMDRLDHGERSPSKRSTVNVPDSTGDERRSKRYRGGRDEFDGPVQYLSKPPRNVSEPNKGDLPPLPVHLNGDEQDDILSQVNKRLSQSAFDFVALYRFPIPMEPDKPPVQSSADKGWTEWAYLLKRLATKRRIPSHAVYEGQIKELTTVLDNSLEMRHATKPQTRAIKEDRAVLQFISAGIQVGKILKDGATMEYLDKLYQQTEKVIQERKGSSSTSK